MLATLISKIIGSTMRSGVFPRSISQQNETNRIPVPTIKIGHNRLFNGAPNSGVKNITKLATISTTQVPTKIGQT